jgi:hypothetical protein
VYRTAAAILLCGGLIGGGCIRHQPPPPRAPASDATRREWPRTVAEAVALELRTMSESEKAAIRASDRERVQDMYHGFQMLHRADFGLSDGNDALLASCGSVSMTGEDCMRIILDALWLALQPPALPASNRERRPIV